MKRVICIMLSVTLLLLLCGCFNLKTDKIKENNILGVWFSYSELDTMLLEGDFKENFLKAVEDCLEFHITDVFIHIRPFCDSLYKSEYFPLRQSVRDKDYDVLEFIIDTCHKKDIRVHAWINPYRVTSTNVDINELPDESPAKKWLCDNETENDINVCVLDGVYLNPCSNESGKLIIEGIREVSKNYDIDGIHFDDYFYPTQSYDFDKISYQKYVETTENPMSQDDFRRTNINTFISSVKNALKYINNDLIFSVSPSASIDKNYNSYYADIEFWLSNNLIDWIMPQLYFGFSYPDKNYCFNELLEDWKKASKESNAKLIIGLASYKIDTENESEALEWSSGDLLMREIEYAKSNADGFCFFSYSSLFGDSENQINERTNIQKLYSRS